VMSTVDGAVFAALADPTRRALFESGVGSGWCTPEPLRPGVVARLRRRGGRRSADP
jgi:hypothetical protein